MTVFHATLIFISGSGSLIFRHIEVQKT